MLARMNVVTPRTLRKDAGRIVRRFADHPYRTLGLLFGLSVALYLAAIPLPRLDGMLIGSDGVGYYVYVRSLIMDGDLDFSDEYSALIPGSDLANRRTPTGRVANQYAVGPALLWSPFFAAGHLVALAACAAGLPVQADGYNSVYQAAVCLGSMVYGFLGMLLVFRIARQLRPRTALAACLLTWLATSFIYYHLAEPSMSHMCSFFSVALLLYLWFRARPIAHWRPCLLIGLAGGLAGAVRQPDATFLLLPAVDLLLSSGRLLRKTALLAVLGAGFILVFGIQMAVWFKLNGSPFLSGYFTDGTQCFSWLSPHLYGVLFSTNHGLFFWHPVLIFAALGSVWLWRTDRRLTTLLVIGLLIQVYLIACWTYWHQSDAFGGRMLIGSLPALALGLAAFLHWASEKRASPACWIGGVCLIAWNALFFLQYRLFFISMHGPYTLRELTIGKLDMILTLARNWMPRLWE